MFTRRSTLSLALALLMGCASDPPPPLACAEATPLTISEGGALTIPNDATRSYAVSPGLSAVVRDASVWIYADYGVSEAATLTVSGADCEDTVVAVEVRPLAWTRLAEWDPQNGGPPGREYGSWWLSDDDAEPGLFVFGGFHYQPRQFTPAWDLWFFDFASGTWSERASVDAPMTPGGRVARGTEPGTIMLHGGAVPTARGSLDTPPVLRVLSYRDAEPTWGEAPHADSAPGSYTGAFVRDDRRDRWLSICGVDSRALGIHCGVAEYTTANGWTTLEVEGEQPPGRFGFHYAYDPESDRVFVVGGQTGPGNLDIGGDTWALDLSETPARWVRLFDESDEVRRRNGAFVFDPIGRRLLLWGGTADGATSKQGLSILRIDPGHERWDHVATPEDVPARASGFAVYDAANERAILGFGNSGRVYTDLYALSL